MSGLGLTNALRGYQEGVAWNDQQKQQAMQNKQLQVINDANAAGAQALQDAHDQDIAQQQKAWTDAGNDPSTFQPKPFQMSAPVLLAGLHARSDAIAKSGDLDLWTKNEAATAPIRNQIRQQVIGKALADYQATGDGAALAQTVYPTVHDGVDITGITVDNGAGGTDGASPAIQQQRQAWVAAGNDPTQFKPQPTTPVYRISTSDGQTHTLTGDQIASMAHDVMMNPADAAKYEYESRLLAAKAAQEANAKKIEAQAKGEQDRLTENVKGGFHLQGIGLENTSREKVAEGNNKATLGAAGIRAGAETEAAGITAQGRVDAAGIRAGGGVDGAKKVQKTITDADGYVVNVFKDGSMQRATVNGQPVRSGEYAKRVDGLVRAARQDPHNMNKSDADLRAAAMQALSGTPPPAPGPAPGLVPKPAASAAVPSVSNW
jgi:hypothetical protein